MRHLKQVPDPSGVATLLVSARVRAGEDAAFAQWRTRLQKAVLARPGCLSCGLLPPSPPEQQDPVTVIRFASLDALRTWRQSPTRKDLVAEASPLIVAGLVAEIAGGAAAEYHVKGLATEVIVTDVKPGKEADYSEWADRIAKAQSAFPGFSGSFVQPAPPGESGWTTIMRFETVEELDGWLKSPARANLLEEARGLVDREMLHRVDTSFPGWTPDDPATGKPPPAWKRATLVLLMLYPVVMVELKFLSPWLWTLNSALATFIGNALSVGLVTWPLMPLALAVRAGPGELLRSIHVPAQALSKNFAFRRSSLTHQRPLGGLADRHALRQDGTLLITVTAATLRPVQLRFAATPSSNDLRRALDAAVPDFSTWTTCTDRRPTDAI